MIPIIQKKIKETYPKVRRWTKNADVFEKDFIVFPINAFSHWFCVIILKAKYLVKPSPDDNAEIIYCDSMLEKRDFIAEAVRQYLRY